MSQEKLVSVLSKKYGVEEKLFYDTLKSSIFKQRDGTVPTDAQMLALLVIANEYNLNLFTKELYAFPDKQGGIIPVVGIDGWCRIINAHPQYDGLEVIYADNKVKMPGAKVECPEWIECVIYSKNRTHPIRIREYLDEVYRLPFTMYDSEKKTHFTIDGPMQTHTKRSLRHKAIIQCARVAFGFSGIYDQDEAERIIEMGEAVIVNRTSEEAISERLPIDEEKLKKTLTGLITRAAATNAWSAAEAYVIERLSKDEQAFALDYIAKAKINHEKKSTLMASSEEQRQDIEPPILTGVLQPEEVKTRQKVQPPKKGSIEGADEKGAYFD